MGFSSEKYKRGSQDRPWKVNPVWRGIGCILFVIIPIMSWFASALILQNYRNISLPPILTQVLTLPTTQIAEIDHVIYQINHYMHSVHFVAGQLFLTILFCFLGYGILAFIYAILYRVAGPPRYGPFDVPPNKV